MRFVIGHPGFQAQRRDARRAGFTVLELMFALSVLVIGLVGYAQVLVITAKSADAAREDALAAQAAREMLKTIQSAGFVQIFGLYNGTTADDPGGVGTAPGANFMIVGLNAASDDADGFPGRIEFPVQSAAPGTLREDLVDARFGTPRDLSGDNVIDGANHAGNYTLIPVSIEVRWQGARGISTYELRTLIANLP